jgi:hypothetical protein
MPIMMTSVVLRLARWCSPLVKLVDPIFKLRSLFGEIAKDLLLYDNRDKSIEAFLAITGRVPVNSSESTKLLPFTPASLSPVG